MQELNKRNTETVAKALEDINNRLYGLQDKVAQQHLLIGSLTIRTQQLEQQIMVLKALSKGTGPSVTV